MNLLTNPFGGIYEKWEQDKRDCGDLPGKKEHSSGNENQANELVELGFAVKIEKAVKVEVKTIKKAVK